MSPTSTADYVSATSELVAEYLERNIALDATRPSPFWDRAQPITFCKDWQGANPDPTRQTQVRLLWSKEILYLRFECRYREISVFEDSDADGRRDNLWERDVVEVFLQPEAVRLDNYKEFEVSPNGMWIDLDIFPEGRAELKSGLRRSVFIDEKRHTWAAELAIPINSLTPIFDSNAMWRVNFFRIEGRVEPRTYHAWLPTRTPQPDFHVPEAFGRLRFAIALR